MNAIVLAAVATLQTALGIWTLLMRAPIDFSLMHQATAMLLLTVATLHAASVAEPLRRAIAPPVRA